ncbi:MAG: AI-2E family transporter [Ruminococcaceae bacterium]|nr:AI-2E family transporter [Oscillospiraceae bacterium]
MKIEKGTLVKIALGVFLLFLAIRHWGDILDALSTLFAAAFPLLIGCVIAYPINILMGFLEKHWFPVTKRKVLIRLRRPVCLIGAILSMLAIVTIVVWLILPQLTDCVMLLVNEVPKAMERCIDFVKSLEILPEDIFKFLDGIDWKSQIGKVINALGSGVGSVMDTVFKTVVSVFSGTVTALIAIIFAVYLLAGKDRLLSQLDRLLGRYLPSLWHRRVTYFAGVLNESFRSFIVGQCTEAVILGLLCTIGMTILRLPYAAMIGALIAFTALIPVAGAYIGAAVGAFMILTVDPMKALVFIIFLVVLQQLEGNIVYPKVVGSSIGLPGIWVLAAVTVGGGLMGVTGMLLGVPLAAALYRIIGDDVNRVCLEGAHGEDLSVPHTQTESKGAQKKEKAQKKKKYK